jgi:acyl carrier protein
MSTSRENPTPPPVSDAVRKAVLDCYCELEHEDSAAAAAGFNGGLHFDSILGVEIAARLEITLSIAIPEDRLMRTSVYSSLSSFATVVQECVDATRKGQQ